MKILRRIWKLFKWTFGILLLLIVLCGFILAIPAVQTRLAQEGTAYLKSEFGIEVQIESASFQLPNRVVLKGVYAPDHRQDTMIYAQHILFEFSGFRNNHLYAGDVELDKGKLLMRKYETDSLFNFAMWLENFNSEDTTTSEVPFQMTFDDIKISDFTYAKHPLGCDECTWLDFKDAEVRVSDFKLNGGNVSGDIERLEYRDDRRFSLHQFSGYAALQETYMELTDLSFKTDSSEVVGWARLEYRDMGDFSNFLDDVRIKGKFEKGVVSSNEFRSYIPQFPQFDQFEFKGSVEGTVNDLKASRVDVAVGNSKFFGDVSLVDCTEPEKLYLNAYVGFCKTNGSDLSRYLAQFIDSEIPELAQKFTDIDLSGHYEGTLADFTTNGEIITNLGLADVNLSFKDLSDLDQVTYNGRLTLESFDLATLLDNPELGYLSTSGSVSGRGLTAESVNASIDVSASRADYNGYSYRNINVLGDVVDGRFTGKFDIHDKNLNVDFDGELDFGSDTATFDFVALVDSTDLHSVGLISDTVSYFGAKVVADFSIYNGEWWQGKVELDSITYRRGTERFQYDEVELVSSNAGSITRNELSSDFMDVLIEGEYKLLKIHEPLLMAFANVNKHFEYEPSFTSPISCTYDITLKETDLLTKLLVPGVRFAYGTRLSGSLNSNDLGIQLNYSSPGMDLYGTYFDTTAIRVRGRDGVYKVRSNIRSIFGDGDYETESIAFNSDVHGDSATLDLRGVIQDSVNSDVHFNGYVVMPTESSFKVHWNSAQFNVGIDTLRMAPENTLVIDGERIEFVNYALTGTNGELYLDGYLSEEPYEVLRARLKNLNLSILNYLLRQEGTYFEGFADGTIILNDLLGSPSMAGYVDVDSLKLNSYDLGTLALNVDWDIASNIQKLNGSITLGTRQTLGIEGRIAQDSTQPLLVDIDLSRFRLNAFNPYMQGILDNLRGTVEGKIRVAGTLDKPTLDGDLELPNAAFGIPFLGTDYNFEGSPTIHLSSDRIVLDRVKIRDTKEGSSGYASGFINHRNLSDLTFDLDIEAQDMLGMDLKEGQNQFFFGKAYASGRVKIVGPTDQMNLRIDVEAEEGTSLKLPLSSPTEVGKSDFITFVDPTESVDSTAFGFRREAKVDDLGGLSITVNANMKPEAEVRLVMDEAVGGEIVGQGSGLIKINLSAAGDLSILGNYQVTEGLYKFRMRNIVANDFIIQEGSTLNWTGDPFDATIDLKAIHTTRTTLTGMVTPGNGYNGQRVRVNLIMHLTGPLMNPNITFDIEVPNVQSSWQEEIKNRLNDQDKLTENAFSLLVTNSFWNPENSIVEDVGQQSVNQLANVMSNWAANSVFGDFADINLSYNTFNEPEVEGSEWEVSVSKAFIDDRIRVNTAVDIPSGDNTGAAQQTVTGDIEVEYKITEDGRFRAKAFNRSNQNNPALDQLSPYSQGVSVFYRADFDSWDELVQKIFGYKPRDVEAEQDTDENDDDVETNEGTEEQPAAEE
ncbi:translocation/assembly module TamB domain-containing protein [Phaeocystidibacter luteus]|uniref:Translocation/assembly module TamB n=1 Tax=Phaeocystidibacter luteus TaxID=911197 RepID=A0A6N6RIU6_9FLAO|nr:translocation/assembly module TamB domain-containing protein [Phaeocystidibacter luteus]KAB2814273.1 translocation/assembly module TamB [Phaeocystidibacter luteus]